MFSRRLAISALSSSSVASCRFGWSGLPLGACFLGFLYTYLVLLGAALYFLANFSRNLKWP